MKIQFLIICALSVTNAAYYDGYNSARYSGNNQYHVPQIQNGVPLETPEVQAAKAQHLQALARAQERADKEERFYSGHYNSDKEQQYSGRSYSGNRYTRPVQSNNIYYSQPAPVYPGPSTSFWQSNAQADTPEVAAAKAAHLALLSKANSVDPHDDGQYRGEQYYQKQSQSHREYNLGPQASYTAIQSKGLQQYSSALPVDTPEVQQAKAAHLAALTQANSRAAQTKHYRYKRSILDYHYTAAQHIPVITKQGVPLETPEVQQAKLQHLLAHSNVKAGYIYGGQQNGGASYGIPVTSSYINYGDYQGYHGPQHVPILGKNGVPIDTPAVQLARHQHFVAHANVQNGGHAGVYLQGSSGSYGQIYQSQHGPAISPNGVPIDTPEVQAAKAKHLIAHAQEAARHAQWQGKESYGYGKSEHYY